MADLYYVVIKDHENSGNVWDEVYCPGCPENWRIMAFDSLEILRQTLTTPQYLSRL